MTTRVGALESTTLGAPPRYPDQIVTTSRKIFTGPRSKSFTKNQGLTTFGRLLRPSNSSRFFQKSPLADVWHYKKCFRHRTTMGVGALQSPDVGAPSKDAQRDHRVSQKILGELGSQTNLKKTQ